jgi:hypothetical protein
MIVAVGFNQHFCRWEHAWRLGRRQPLVAGLSAALIVALLAGTTASAYFAVKERQRAIESDAYAAQAEKNAREAQEYAARLQVSKAQEKANARKAMEAKALAEENARQAKESRRQAEEMARKVIDANQREIAARVDALLPDAKFSKEDLKHLEEQVRAADEIFQIVDARLQAGTVTQADTSEAKAQLFIAKGRLAWAKGDLLQCQKEYDGAVAASKVRASIVLSQYKVGTVDYPTLANAELLQHEAELAASRVKGRIARGANNVQPGERPAKGK